MLACILMYTLQALDSLDVLYWCRLDDLLMHTHTVLYYDDLHMIHVMTYYAQWCSCFRVCTSWWHGCDDMYVWLWIYVMMYIAYMMLIDVWWQRCMMIWLVISNMWVLQICTREKEKRRCYDLWYLTCGFSRYAPERRKRRWKTEIVDRSLQWKWYKGCVHGWMMSLLHWFHNCI